jgi:hypothetical protein
MSLHTIHYLGHSEFTSNNLEQRQLTYKKYLNTINQLEHLAKDTSFPPTLRERFHWDAQHLKHYNQVLLNHLGLQESDTQYKNNP